VFNKRKESREKLGSEIVAIVISIVVFS